MAYLASLVGERQLAEDLLQETFVAAWRSAAGFRGQATARTWLLAIARGKVRDAARRRVLSLAGDDAALAAVPGPAGGPAERLIADAGVDAVMAAVGGLRPLLREVVVLALVEELSMREIAAPAGRAACSDSTEAAPSPVINREVRTAQALARTPPATCFRSDAHPSSCTWR